MLTIIELLWGGKLKDILQLTVQRKLRASLFSILSKDKLESGFNGTYTSTNSIHIGQRMQRRDQMVGVHR